jgi:hypothetical protein
MPGFRAVRPRMLAPAPAYTIRMVARAALTEPTTPARTKLPPAQQPSLPLSSHTPVAAEYEKWHTNWRLPQVAPGKRGVEHVRCTLEESSIEYIPK